MSHNALYGALLYTPEETFAQPFSIERHKKTFINYMEAIIDSDGVVYYAIPSHERKLIKLILEQNPGMSIKDIENEAEKIAGLDGWAEYLMRKSGCICIYTNGYTTPQHYQMSDAQKRKLDELIKAHLTTNKNFNMCYDDEGDTNG